MLTTFIIYLANNRKIFLFLFQADTIKILWSYGDKDPIFDEMKGHGINRGVKSLHLMAPMARKPLHNRDVRQWDLTVKNVS